MYDRQRRIGRRTPAHRLPIIGLLSAGLAGCSQVPDYQRPNLAALSSYSNNETRDASVSPVWWRAFSSRELNALEEKGLGRNLDVQAAIARLEQAQGTAAIVSAALVPTIALGGTLDRQTGLSNKNTQQASFQAGYELDFWGKNRAASDSSKSLVAATSSDADTVAVTLAATIANTYFQILSLKERIGQAQRIAGDARRILSLIQAQQTAGAASELQVEQQRNATATFQANVPVLQQQLDQSLHLLAVLVGEQPDSMTVGAHNLGGLRPPEPRSGLPSSLLERRPDIQAAEARLISANFDVGAARAAFLPSVTISASAGLTAASLAKFFPATVLTDTALGLAQPILDGGRLQGQLTLDRAHVTELVATYRQTILTALQDVEDALSARRRLKALAAANLEAVTSARKSQALAEQQYKLGGADYLTVLNTQRSLFQAEDAYLQVRLQQLQAAVGLFRALGGGFAGTGGRGAGAPVGTANLAPKPL